MSRRESRLSCDAGPTSSATTPAASGQRRERTPNLPDERPVPRNSAGAAASTARSAAPFPPAIRAARSGAHLRAAERPTPRSPARAGHPASPRLPSARSRSGVQQRPRISWPGRCVPDALSGSGGADGLWLQWLVTKLTRKPPGLLSKDRIRLMILGAYVYGRALAKNLLYERPAEAVRPVSSVI